MARSALLEASYNTPDSVHNCVPHTQTDRLHPAHQATAAACNTHTNYKLYAEKHAALTTAYHALPALPLTHDIQHHIHQKVGSLVGLAPKTFCKDCSRQPPGMSSAG